MGTQIILAQRSTKQAQGWFETTTACRVLHRFEHVCNLVNQEGNVIAIHNAGVPIGPFSLVVTKEEFSTFDFSQSIKLHQESKLLSIGSSRVSIQGSHIWDALPQWSSFNLSSIDTGISKPSNTISTLTEQLVEGIRANKGDAVEAASTALAGLGSGLTPAGDDVLIGIIYALFVLGWEPEWGNLIHEASMGRTTTLSAAFLKSAANGEAIEPWHHLVNGKSGALEQLIAFGQSSGRDALFGFQTALNQLSSA